MISNPNIHAHSYSNQYDDYIEESQPDFIEISKKGLLESSTKFSIKKIEEMTLCNLHSHSFENKSTETSCTKSEEIVHLNLSRFKISPCTKKYKHSNKTCLYYHDNFDRRRDPTKYNYLSEMCWYVTNHQTCPKGDECNFCHNH